MAIPRFAWGIDVGNRALKAVKLVRDGETLRIDDFEVIEHEQILSQAGDNRESLLQSSLAQFAQRHPPKGGAVAIGVSGQASFARFIKLPPVDPTKIPEIVKFEAIQQIPFPLEDVEWSYQLFQAPDSPEVEVGIFAMRRELVNLNIKYFTDVGLEVNAVQMNPLAVYNGLYADGRLDGTTMIVDVGAENSDLIIAEGETIWMRSIPIGGNNFTEALVKSFKLKFPKAEELKRNAATSKYGRQILQAMKPVFSDLVGEIQRSIGFYSSTHRDSRIGKVLALGGTFRLPGLQKYLQQNLQLDVARMDRLNAPTPADARFAAAFNENILSSIGAYGLALQAMGQAKITSSLLPEKIRRERMWREKTRWFGLAASLFVAGTAVSVGELYANRYAYDSQVADRAHIEQTTRQAKALDSKWKNIESSGSDDRALITSYMSLLADRDVTIGIAEEIGRAFPTPPSEAELKKIPRSQRETVDLVAFNMHYEPNITGPLGQKDDNFNPMADHIDLNGGSNNGGGGYTPPPQSAMPSFPGGPGGSASSAAPKRGYLVTILCRTPNADPTPLVERTVLKALQQSRNQNSSNPPRNFSIERVTIPSKVKLSAAYPSGLIRPRKPALIFTPPSDTAANGLQQGSTPPLSPEEQFADPMHPGENMRDDSLVTVLAAIVIDPPPKAKAEAK